ncbi:MAG TPA: arabinofuranosidase catalytic domain-containing protein [Acidobacteriaceae bacterium]|nr:arabinofuranosidase catalytic domain-containing protein [Acidobacteriaceae bacterium]
MRSRKDVVVIAVFMFVCVATALAQTRKESARGPLSRPQGPCDIYAAAGDPCVAAHSTTRALYQSYNGPLYQVLRQSDAKTVDINVVQPGASSSRDAGGYADAAAQDAFCANTYCWITKVYDQSPDRNDLSQAPRGGFSGPAMGGMNSLPLADMAPITVMGHKVYGVFIEPGTGLRIDDPKGTAVDDQAEGIYWVIDGHHFNGGCCFDYGNAEIDSRDDDNGTMETAYFGDTTGWIHGNPPGPWIETDQENNLVGCVNTDGSRLCAHLADIHWRFVTAIAKGEPHRWASLGGDAQRGPLTVLFDGQRVNSSYDPMRKQGAILLGNGGDNSNSSQGTFYEGAVTASGTFPSDATDQLVQANIVAAGYEGQRLSVKPASAKNPTGVQTFSPGAAKDTTVTFTNTSGAPVKELVLTLKPPTRWTAVAQGTKQQSTTFSDAVAPGASVSATFTVIAGPTAFNGDLIADASWSDAETGVKQTDTTSEKVRSVAPVRINEFRIGSGGNPTDSFVELYNAGDNEVDLSGWSLTERPAQQTVFSRIEIPAGTRLKPKGFYLLGLSNSGLAVSAWAGDATLNVRDVKGMSAGDTLQIGIGKDAEIRKIEAVGSAASDHTTLWQPLPDGPITLPAGSTNVPVQSVVGFKVGEKIALGYGSAVPFAAIGTEQYETATVTAVGKPGTQAYLAADAPAGATNLQVTAVEDVSAGDKIRLDIDSSGHGIETVTVARVGTKATRTNLTEDVSAGATRIGVRRADGFAVGDKITVGTPASKEVVTVSSLEQEGQNGAAITFAPALSRKHGRAEWVVSPGTGLDLAAPLRFSHAANLPFSDRGTGISFEPATRFVHVSDEPVQALGSGVTLDRPLVKGHRINSVVRDKRVTTAGYQGDRRPDQWFGGPELTTRYLLFGRMIPLAEGSLVLRDVSGVVADSLNYGGLSDPWAAKGYQAESGERAEGCFVPAPEPGGGYGMRGGPAGIDRSAGRFPDGADTDSNCTDFVVAPATLLPFGATAGSTTVKVASVAGFHAGEKVLVGTGADGERAVVASVGTAGATTTSKEVAAGSTTIPVASPFGFESGQTITVGTGANVETMTMAAISRGPAGFAIVIAAPLKQAHGLGSQISGTGLTLGSPLTRSHAAGEQVRVNVPTPGGPNESGAPDAASESR